MTDQAREPRPTGFEQVLAHPPQHILEAPPIKVVDVTVRFDGTTALDQVSFRVPQAEKVAVVGPNGAGKTTLLKVLSGILAPSSGDVQVYGYGPASHVCIAYVPQRSQVDWRFPVSVADVVMMGRIKKLGLLRAVFVFPILYKHDAIDLLYLKYIIDYLGVFRCANVYRLINL